MGESAFELATFLRGIDDRFLEFADRNAFDAVDRLRDGELLVADPLFELLQIRSLGGRRVVVEHGVRGFENGKPGSSELRQLIVEEGFLLGGELHRV